MKTQIFRHICHQVFHVILQERQINKIVTDITMYILLISIFRRSHFEQIIARRFSQHLSDVSNVPQNGVPHDVRPLLVHVSRGLQRHELRQFA